MSDNYIEEIIQAKKELDDSLKNFPKRYQDCSDEIDCITQVLGELITRHTSILNTVNQVLAKAHKENNFFKDENLRRDYVATIENFIPISLKIIEISNRITDKHSINKITITSNSYSTIQRFINTFSDTPSKESIKSLFQKNNISVDNFKNKFKKPMKKKLVNLQLYVGIPLLVLCGVTIMFGEQILGQRFNGIQLIFLKALLALSISVVGSSLIEGNVDTKWTINQSLTIRAVGWVGIFLILFFLNPASPSDVHG